MPTRKAIPILVKKNALDASCIPVGIGAKILFPDLEIDEYSGIVEEAQPRTPIQRQRKGTPTDKPTDSEQAWHEHLVAWGFENVEDFETFMKRTGV